MAERVLMHVGVGAGGEELTFRQPTAEQIAAAEKTLRAVLTPEQWREVIGQGGVADGNALVSIVGDGIVLRTQVK